METPLESDARRMAELYPEGFTSQQIVNFFKKHSIRMGEATFRKYVQMGLLPRCRRVGRKGKHRGSRGIYPTKVLKRIITIRDLMDQGYTMDEIKDGMMRFRGRIDDVERSVNELFAEFEKELARGPFQTDRGRRQTAAEELAEARRTAEDLLNRLEGLEKSFTEPRPMAAAEATEELTDTADHKFF